MALLLGIEEAEFRAEWHRQMAAGSQFRTPKVWLQQGMRIARETAAATGSYDLAVGLAYLRANREGMPR